MSWSIRTEGLGKAFTLHLQGGTRIPVLDGVDLSVAPGECVEYGRPTTRGS
jgi:alpha-D-ribose 1-methylphosphonate 5-triphosphate synthase subunit PhnL